MRSVSGAGDKAAGMRKHSLNSLGLQDMGKPSLLHSVLLLKHGSQSPLRHPRYRGISDTEAQDEETHSVILR